MKNRKLMKSVMNTVVCTSMAFTMFALSACNVDKPDDEPPAGQATQLDAPEIELDGWVISWNAVEHADNYKVIEGSTTVSTQAETTYTIDKTVAGDYVYTVVATSSSDEYLDSDASNSVTYRCVTYTVSFNSNGGSSVQNQTVVEGKMASKPEGVTNGAYGIIGWFTDEECTDENLYDFSKPVTGPLNLYAKWGDLITTTADIVGLAAKYGSGTKITSDVTEVKFTYSSGLYFETAGTVNTQGKNVAVKLEGLYDTNEISFTAKGASGSNIVTLTIAASDGSTVYTWVADSTSASTNVVVKGLKAGTYTIKTSTSCRLSNIKLTEVLEVGAPTEITEIIPQKVDFLKNDTFSSDGLSAKVLYDNGGTRTVTDLKVDTSQIDMTQEGEYTVGVSYTVGEGNNAVTVNGSYKIYVYSVSGIKLATSTTNGNITTNLQTVYVENGTLSTAGLTVFATAKCSEKETEFKLAASQYTLSDVDLTTTGTKTVTVTAKANAQATASYDITVKTAIVSENNQVAVSVNPNGSADFETITEALQYLKASKLDNGIVKVVNIADGEYKEKVYIDIPNVHIVGSATNTPNATTNNGVVIWYDAISGKTDANGSAYGTNGSASVTVASGATGFVAQNITFKNYYNTNALYKESLAISSNSQAVALLIESASASFYNCKMTGYHDTLYANKGNHYFEKCWIEGHTDFIFGSTVHGYFYQCTIYSIGAGASEKNGGYIVAAQGDSTYYYVFNGCDFTSDANVMDGSIALGRAWGANMKMVVINSTISGKYSTAAHTTGTGNGQRYCTMSGNEPKPENMLEYNNTGDGAISASIANTCTYMTETQAEAYQYDKLSVILGFEPGVVENKISYIFADEANFSNNPFTYSDAMTVNGNYSLNHNSIRINAGTTIVMKGKGEVTLTWYAENQSNLESNLKYGYTNNAQIVYKDGFATITFVTDTSEAAHGASGIYLYAINLNADKIPEDTPVTSATEVISFKGLLSSAEDTVEGTTKNYESIGITVDATNGKFGYNSETWVQVNTGTKIIIPAHESGLAVSEVTITFNNGSLGAESFELVHNADGSGTITVNVSNYISEISVTYAVNVTPDAE